jgi:hypothetical protein
MVGMFTILMIIFSAVIFGIFNRRWSIACSIFVLHIAIAGFIIGCVAHWPSAHQRMASPSGQYAPDKDKDSGKHVSVISVLKRIQS